MRWGDPEPLFPPFPGKEPQQSGRADACAGRRSLRFSPGSFRQNGEDTAPPQKNHKPPMESPTSLWRQHRVHGGSGVHCGTRQLPAQHGPALLPLLQPRSPCPREATEKRARACLVSSEGAPWKTQPFQDRSGCTGGNKPRPPAPEQVTAHSGQGPAAAAGGSAAGGGGCGSARQLLAQTLCQPRSAVGRGDLGGTDGPGQSRGGGRAGIRPRAKGTLGSILDFSPCPFLSSDLCQQGPRRPTGVRPPAWRQVEAPLAPDPQPQAAGSVLQ